MPYRRDDADLRTIQMLVNRFLSLPPQQRKLVIIVVLIAAVLIGIVYWETRTPTGPYTGAAPESPQMLLGNPSHATPDAANRNDYLMLKPYFALSYNDANGTPNWVSWRVQRSDLGDAPRKPAFDPDTTLPMSFKVVVHKDYSGSGFDRGHMCPHSDRAANTDMSYATFVMSNIIPQAPNVNRKAWAQLESYCRELVSREHDRLYITAGPVGQGGRGSRGAAETITGGKVLVPARCWKVIVVVPEDGGDDDLAKVNTATRVIAVDMPNDNDAVGEEWASFRTSAGAIEQKTGFHFFGRVRPEIAGALRQQVDRLPIAPPKPMFHTGD